MRLSLKWTADTPSMPVTETDKLNGSTILSGESHDIRKAFGSFATGVAIATTAGSDGSHVGMTISSFNTVSIDPPLILWSIAKNTVSFETFSQADYFAVHVLAENQKHLSRRFATTDHNKFADIECETGLHGVPILPDFSACFECNTEHRYAGGDHMIIVGRVLRFKGSDSKPLIFHNGEYSSKGDLID